MYWKLDAEIWRDEEGGVVYYVAQNFSEDGSDPEVLASGEATDEEDARKQVFQAISEVCK
jgi:hypothetical protein